MTEAGPRAVDEYIAAAPKAAQPQLRQLRATIRRAAPNAVEKISYGIPFFEYHGRLIYFAAFKKHVGIYPAGDDAEELKEYVSGRSTLRFPIGERLPLARITRLVKRRVKEKEAKACKEP
jgi:uncharacterized protein YdhG (YjbR/CyaY superfamily)